MADLSANRLDHGSTPFADVRHAIRLAARLLRRLPRATGPTRHFPDSRDVADDLALRSGTRAGHW